MNGSVANVCYEQVCFERTPMVCARLFKGGIEMKRIVRHIWPFNGRDWPALFWPKIASR